MNRRRTAGFSRFELGVVVIVVSLLMLPLIAALSRYQGIVERQQMEHDIRDMRTFLNLKLLDLMMSNRRHEIDRLAGSNPVLLLERAPKNYLGERDSVSNASQGGWAFDRQRRELTYVPSSFSFPYRAEEEPVLRWQLQRIKGSEMSVRLIAVITTTQDQKPALAR